MESNVPVVSERQPSSNGGKLEAVALKPNDVSLGTDVMDIVKKAQSSWLKNEEVLTVLEFFQGLDVSWPEQAAWQPDGMLFYIERTWMGE